MFGKVAGLTVFVLVASAALPAAADDWTGQAPPPAVAGAGGPAVFPGVPMATENYTLICVPSNTPPPCTGGSHVTYTFTGHGTPIGGLPASAAAADSNVGVQFMGAYADPTSPSGVSIVSGTLPLSEFARSTTVDALSGTVGGLGTTVNGLTTTVGGLSGTVGSLSTTVGGLSTTVNGLTASVSSLNSTVGLLSGTVGTLSSTVAGLSASIGTINTNLGSLSTTVGGLGTTVTSLQSTVNSLNASVGTISTQLSSLSVRFDQFQQQVHVEEQTLREGVAMSLAMSGVGELGPDEHVAISMNVGTYGGQNGVAAGVAFRAAEHLTFNGGIGTGFNRGLVGGRAGVRLAW
jgi:uncharacterized protein YoxC